MVDSTNRKVVGHVKTLRSTTDSEMAAFDSLPREFRDMINYAAFPYSSRDLKAKLLKNPGIDVQAARKEFRETDAVLHAKVMRTAKLRPGKVTWPRLPRVRPRVR